ncbi:MAG TPA: signal peptidase I [Thermoleophilaceae bacterium]|jgi:signal peptidase I
MVGLIRRVRSNSLVELVVLVAVALFLALTVQAYAVKPYRIPSGSMEPTLTIGQRVIVDRLTHRLGSSPSVGDIVVFNPPAGADDEQCGAQGQGEGTGTPCSRPQSHKSSETFIKRVVAVGGDTIAIRDGHVVRNGKPTSEPFAASCGGGQDCNFPHTITVPHGYVFMMGDNRGQSDDSRFWGPVPISWVIGRALVTYWPPDRVGTL